MQTNTSLFTELDALPARWEVTATLPAPVSAVAAHLLAVAEGRVSDDNLMVLARAAAARTGALTIVARSGAFRVEWAGRVHPVEIQVDQARCALAVQSWYAGVYKAMACPTGTRVTHSVYRTLQEHPGFTDGIAELGLHTRMSRDLRQVLSVIADRLGCSPEIAKGDSK